MYEDDLPINPLGAYLTEEDVILDKVDIMNWSERRKSTFRPRLRDKIQQTGGISIDEDDEYDCD